MRALHALTLLCAVHALQLHVPSLQQEHGGHEHLLWHAGLYCGQGPWPACPQLIRYASRCACLLRYVLISFSRCASVSRLPGQVPVLAPCR